MASLKTTEVLDKIKAELESIDPTIGKVFATLRASADPEDLITDYLVKDTKAGKVLKAWVIHPGRATIKRSTIGNTGFSNRMRTIVIDGFMTIQHKNEPESDRILMDELDKVILKLQSLQRLQTEAQGDTFHPGNIEMTPLGVAKVSNHNVIAAQLMIVIQDRFLGS